MAENWESVSEIVAGKLIKGRLSLDVVRPELFIQPFDRIVQLMKEGLHTPEELIERIGLSPISVALDAANAVTQKNIDWIMILEQCASKAQLAEELRIIAKKLDRGESTDVQEIIEKYRQIDNKKPYMTPLNEVQPIENPFMESGWTGLDAHINGLPQAGLITCGAMPGAGKTTLMIKLIISFIRTHKNKKAGIFTLEMPAGELKHRIIELCPDLTETEMSRIVVEDGMLEVHEVSARASRETNLGIIAVDFADLMVRGDVSEPQMASIYITLASLAKTLNIPILLISQLNRNYMGGVPLTRHLRYTSLAEALSWMIWMIYSPSKDFYGSTEDHKNLPNVPGASYLVIWKCRGGFRIHPNNNPGAIQFPFSGSDGWGENAIGNGWFKLDFE